jgi:hypothetical protein
MSRFVRCSVMCLVAGTALSACRPDEVLETTLPPAAGVRFINAVPDSAGAFGLDFRFVDVVENSAHFRIGFRNSPATSAGVTAATSAQFKASRTGTRDFAIFLNDTLQNIASTVVATGKPTLEEGKNYTYILWGRGRAGTMRLANWAETVTVPTGKVCLRVINATESPINATTYVTGATVPAVPTWANVPGLSASAFRCDVDPASIRYNVRAVGATTDLFADLTALPGNAATSTAGAGGKLDISSTPGTTVAGSAISLIVFPASTAGSRAAQFTTAGGAFVWDARPPRGF